MVPSVPWFVYAFVRKEAVLSAQIEGTQATLMDLLEVEASGAAPVDADVEEVSGYVDALEYAWAELGREEGLPISTRLLSQAHRRLLSGARGATKQPGAIRQSQNWIGGTRPGNAAFVPPPPHRLGALLGDLERYVHDESELPPLLRVGLVQAQFETLHPYLDAFFLEGVASVAREAVATARQLHAVVTECRARLLARDDATVLALRLFELLPERPVMTVSRAVGLLDCSRPAAGKAIRVLEAADVVQPRDDRTRDRAVIFGPYLDHLREGTEPLAR